MITFRAAPYEIAFAYSGVLAAVAVYTIGAWSKYHPPTGAPFVFTARIEPCVEMTPLDVFVESVEIAASNIVADAADDGAMNHDISHVPRGSVVNGVAFAVTGVVGAEIVADVKVITSVYGPTPSRGVRPMPWKFPCPNAAVANTNANTMPRIFVITKNLQKLKKISEASMPKCGSFRRDR